jgi:hypothetical protein
MATLAIPKPKGDKCLSRASTAEGSELLSEPTTPVKVEIKKKSLSKLKKAIIITLTQSSFDYAESGPDGQSLGYTTEEYLTYYKHMCSKFKRLFVQEFHTKEILMFSMELYRKVLKNATATGTEFNRMNDSLFKIFVVCFFIANKFVDEMHYISADDLAYMAHTKESVVKSLEIALLNDVLGWSMLDLKKKDSKGRYRFLRWDYRHVVKSFQEAFN